jgi:hypothetical protein
MIIFIGSGLFIGGLIGARLTVLALIPATFLAIGVAAFSWAVQAATGGWELHHLIAVVTFFQFGYLAGASVRLFVAPHRVARRGGPTVSGSRLRPHS